MVRLMQGGYDGSVNIDTSIDFNGFDAGVKDLIQALKNLDVTITKLTEQMQGKFENLTANNATDQLNNVSEAATAAADNTTDSTTRIEHAVQDMENSLNHASGQGLSESIGQTTEALGQQESALNTMTEDVREYVADTRNSASELEEINLFPDVTNPSERSQKLYEEAEKYRHKLEELEARGLHSGDSEYDRTYDAMSKCHEESLAIERQQRGYTNAVENTQTTYENLSNTVERLKEKLAALKERGMGEGNDQFDTVYKELKQAQNDLKAYRTGLNAEATSESGMLDNLHNKVKKINAELIRLKSQGFGAGNELFDTKYQELIKAEDELKRYMAQLRETALTNNSQFDNLNNRVERLKAGLAELRRQGMGFGNEEFDATSQELTRAQDELKRYMNTLREEAISNNSQFDNLNNRVEELKARIAELRRQGMGFGNEDYDNAVREYRRAVDEMREYERNLYGHLYDVEPDFKEKICAAFVRVRDVASSTLKKIGSLGKRAFGKLGSLAVHAFGKITRSSKKSNKSLSAMDNSLGKVVKKISRMAKTILFFRLFRQGLTNLRNYLGTALKANEQFTDSLGRIKGNLKTAFMPVYNAIMPALNTLMSALVKLTGYLAQITAQLFGSSIKAMQDQAAAIDQTAESAKKANKQLGKYDSLNVISSDSKEDSKSNNTIYGDIETSSKLTDLIKSLEDAFKNGDYSKIGSIVADKINSALATLDFSKIQSGARKVASGVGELLNGFVGTLNTSLLGQKIAELLNAGLTGANEFLTTFDFTKLGQKISEGINGLADSIDWDLAGETFANKWNAWIHGLSGLLNTLDFSGIASGVASGLNAIIYTIDWNSITSSISNGINGALTAAITLFRNVDFKELAFNIMNALSSVDWNTTIYNALTAVLDFAKVIIDVCIGALEGINFFELLNEISTGIVDFAKEYDWKEAFKSVGELIGQALIAAINVVAFVAAVVQSIGEYFLEYIEAAGGTDGDFWTAGVNIAEGILMGILAALANIGTWIIDNIFKPIWNGIKSAFDIHSPSKKMKEIGENIIQGMLNGIKSCISAIVNLFKNLWKDIKNVFKGIYTWFKETFQSAKNGIVAVFGNIGAWFGNRWKDIKNAFKGIYTWFKETFQSAKNGIVAAFGAIGSWFGNRWSDIKGAFGDIASWFRGKFADAWDGIKGVFSKAGSFFSGIWKDIKGAFGDIAGWFEDKFSKAWQKVKDVFCTGGKIFSGITEGIGNVLGGVIEKILEGINWVIRQPLDFLNGILNKIRNVEIDLKFKVFHPFKSLWGQDPIPVPQIPKLASGAIIPPNREFLAVLGDQRNGMNIEAPADLIKKMAKEAIIEAGINNDSNNGNISVYLTLEGDAKGVFKLVKTEYRKEKKQRLGTTEFA
ncbi:MAG: hypothetical protein HFI34_06825 [Lachnospiraceae bacterium]|nr:hypothetical protein [Lachnospiraceae bacterium]